MRAVRDEAGIRPPGIAYRPGQRRRIGSVGAKGEARGEDRPPRIGDIGKLPPCIAGAPLPEQLVHAHIMILRPQRAGEGAEQPSLVRIAQRAFAPCRARLGIRFLLTPCNEQRLGKAKMARSGERRKLLEEANDQLRREMPAIQRRFGGGAAARLARPARMIDQERRIVRKGQIVRLLKPLPFDQRLAQRVGADIGGRTARGAASKLGAVPLHLLMRELRGGCHSGYTGGEEDGADERSKHAGQFRKLFSICQP